MCKKILSSKYLHGLIFVTSQQIPIFIKKFELDIEFEYDFLLYGIVSQEKPHRLVWFLNKIYPYHFSRVDDYEIEINSKLCAFAQFTFIHEENHTTYTLIGNRDESQLLIPELKNFDYLLLIKGAVDFFEEETLKEHIKTIPTVQIIFEVETEKLKSKHNLVYV